MKHLLFLLSLALLSCNHKPSVEPKKDFYDVRFYIDPGNTEIERAYVVEYLDVDPFYDTVINFSPQIPDEFDMTVKLKAGFKGLYHTKSKDNISHQRIIEWEGSKQTGPHSQGHINFELPK